MNETQEGPLIVGFGHRRRVGKDTLAGMVANKLRLAGVKVFSDAFAWQLKESARHLFGYAGLAGAAVYDKQPELREVALPGIGLSPRDLWIAYGTKMREIAPDVWLRGVLDNPAYVADAVLLVSDVRYPNEVKAIRDRGGLLVKVVRPGVPKSDDVADSALAGMKTLEWDLAIINDRDLDALSDKADAVARFILERLTARRMAGRKPPDRVTVGVDFDGVLCRQAWPGIGEEMPDAFRFLRWLEGQGIAIVLWTARTGHLLDAALAWLADRDWPLSRWAAINDTPEEVKRYYGEEGRKLGADIFVDDRNTCFPVRADDPDVPDWPRIQTDIARRMAEFNAARA